MVLVKHPEKKSILSKQLSPSCPIYILPASCTDALANTRMLLYITIGILFAYTVILIGFFMGWCTLIPTKCHPRRGIPFSSVKSPRRNTKFVEIDSISSSTSLDMYKQIPRKFSRKKLSLPQPTQPYRVSDYLHPKYSLPPVKIDTIERTVSKWEFEQLLRTPGKAVRHTPSPHKLSECESVAIQIE